MSPIADAFSIPNPASVPCTYISSPDQLPDLTQALRNADRVAIDTEVPIADPCQGELRVMSVAVRNAAGIERAFVVDARDLAPALLAPVLAGVTADAWNANFDARVIDHAVYPDSRSELHWWDAQLADALLHQGRSGFNWFHGLAWATEHYLGLVAEGKGTVQLSYTAYDDLSADQISYAAADAVETLWVGDAIRAEIAAAGLQQVCEIEMGARPFLDRMERTGMPFDWAGWEQELEKMEIKSRQVIGRLADLTGGGQGTLFDEVVEPSWNPASDRQVRIALNTWSTAQVMAWTETHRGGSRLLVDGDSVTAGVLREISGELSETLLEFRSYAKILSTYGESIRDHIHADGRMRPQYLQVVGTNTGRLASRNPNAQNLTPQMKPYLRPSSTDRVFVHADLSQAELRFLAQVSDDGPLRAAFARGEDVHVSTAATMFRFDPVQLKAEDPVRFKELRQIAKALNFGIAYGQGAAALARSLTHNGTPTTTEEGRELLAQYRATYPGTAAWAADRDNQIHLLRDEVGAIDWALSLRLARSFGRVSGVRWGFRKLHRRWPTAGEIATVQREQLEGTTIEEDEIRWVLQYSAPVALLSDAEPFTFSSRTLAGRRQQFNLHLDRLFLTAAIDAVSSPTPQAAEVRRAFEAEHGVVFIPPGQRPDQSYIADQFEDRMLRHKYVDAVAQFNGDEVAHGYLTRAAKERVSAMVTAWRNAPIQGGVADIMLVAYGDLHRRLMAFPDAAPVQTVHDSVVIECDRHNAGAVADEVRMALECASVRFCPDVTPKADVDIRSSLAESDVIEVV